ncbi:sulfatase [Pontiella sulfatireligans]|uniref:Arylsulfatase n=1 Tax=Pontiella sulfatireligans TaxID=2750658 RepID=A0A6C2UH48_9BACT|nr:sulfatase [Pontiella sulfatireligans]SPS74240.1 sulfatase S1_16 [Kiritimatiellales bacterium]VGO18741.1 Arylsulfatase [Pontiella sulfatireligans]
MKKRYLLCVLLALGTISISAEKKPNVLFILIDDFGWKDVGYNGNTFYETPVMDKLSEEWMRFDSCYTPSPMCSPTRVSILTGQNPARHGITQWLPGRDRPYLREGEKARVYCPKPQSPGIKESEVTLGEAFQQAGYETAFYGKWHMGALKTTGGPKKHGYASEKAVIESNRCEMFFPFRNPDYFPGAKKGDNFTDKLTDVAIDFVTAERDKPFYLHLCHFAMHYPIASKPELRGKFTAKAAALGIKSETALDDYSHQPHKIRQDSPEYAGELATLDGNIGRLIDALKASGQHENTIIILTGDNGGRATVNLPNATAVQPLRGGKTFVFEGGLRTPLLIYWPNHSKAGMRTDVPVMSTDFYPTLLEMAGLSLMPEQHRDGVSLVPLFNGGKLERDTLYWHFPHYQGEGSYPASAIRVGNYKLIHNYHHDDVLLYDIVNDPGETKNLALFMPEKAAMLNAQLMKYLEETGAYIPVPDARIKSGGRKKSKKKGKE